MTNKSAAMQTSSSGKAKLNATKSLPAFTSPSSRLQLERRLRSSTKQVHPVVESRKSATKWREFPNEEFGPSIDNSTYRVIDTVAEPYLVPITTKTLESSKSRSNQASKTRKVALLPKTAQSSTSDSPQSVSLPKNWESFVRTGKPIPPPKIVAKRASSCKIQETKKEKLTSSKRRDLAYLVVELDHSERRKKSLDDLDAELKLKSVREERSSLTRSNTISESRTSQQQRHCSPPQASSTMSTPRLNSPSSRKQVVGKISPDSSLTQSRPMPGEKQSSRSKPSTESGETAGSPNLSDLSSDTFLSSADSNDSSTLKGRANKRRESALDLKKRRAPPPPPVVTTPPLGAPPPPRTAPPPPPTNSTTLRVAQRGTVISPQDSINRTRSLGNRKMSEIQRKTMSKSSSATQIKGGRPPTRPAKPPISSKPTLKETKSVQSKSTQKPHMKVRPHISTPHLISSTKTIPSTPVTGKYRIPPSPPAEATSKAHQFPHDEFSEDTPAGQYEEVDFDEPMPRPPPRRKRTMSKSVPAVTKQNSQSGPSQVQRLQAPRRGSGTPNLLLVQSRVAQLRMTPSPEPRTIPEDYLEPKRKSPSFEDDEPLSDYEVMGPGTHLTEPGRTEWSPQEKVTEIAPAPNPDGSEDCYVDMQPIRDPFEEPSDPVYEYMNPKEFLKPRAKNPPEKKESLYYAISDLVSGREDLKAPVKNRSKTKKMQKP